MSSGTEEAINAFTQLANLLSIFVTVSVIITALLALVRYLRGQVGKRVDSLRDEMKGEFRDISDKIHYADKETEQRSVQNEQTITQLKWLMEQMEKSLTGQMNTLRQDFERLEERRTRDVTMIRDRILRLENKIINGKHDGNSSDSEITRE